MNRMQRVQQWLVFSRQWHVIDATRQDADALGARVATYLQGRHKPIYHDETDCGDHVVVRNCRHISMNAFEWKHREYLFNKEYPRSKAFLPAWKIHEYDPCRIMFMSVYKALGNDLPRRRHIERLHLFPNEHVSPKIHANISHQIDQVQAVPRRSDEYTADERAKFPALFDWKREHLQEWQEPLIMPEYKPPTDK